MKKITRFLTLALIMMVGFGFAIATSVDGKAFAEMTPGITAGNAFSIQNVPSSGTVGTEITIPTSSNVTYIITDPYGEKVDATEIVDNKFSPKYIGQYVLQYTFTTDTTDNVVSPEFIINVTREESYSYSYKTNSKILVPTIINSNKTVTIAYPIILDKDGKVIVDEYGIVDDNYELIITVNAGDSKKYNNVSGDSIADLGTTNIPNESGTQKSFYTFVTEEGNNTISISVKDKNSDTIVYTLPTKTIVGDNSYDTSKIDVAISVDNIPSKSSISLGTKTYLPYATATDKQNPNVPLTYYTTLSIKTGTNNVPVYEDEKGFYFIPQIAGDYTLTYNVYEYFKGEIDSKKASYEIKDIKDRNAPNIVVTESYADKYVGQDVDSAEFINTLESATYLVPTKVDKTNTAILMPAIYAYDDFDGEVAYSKVTRKITGKVNGVTKTYDLNDSRYNYYESSANLVADTYEEKYLVKEGDTHLFLTSEEYNDEKYSDKKYDKLGLVYLVKEEYRYMYTATFIDADKLTSGNEYTVSYTASDKAGNSKTVFTRTFTVGSYTATNPTIKLGDIASVAKIGDTVSFAPVVSDDNDSDIKVTVYVYDSTGTTVEIGDNKTVQRISKVDDKFTFEVTETMINAGNITVYIIAETDLGGKSTIVKDIKFIDVNDNTVPTIEAQTSLPGGVTNTFEQYSTIYVPGVTASDNNSYWYVKFEVRDNDGNIVTGAKMTGDTIADGINFKGNKAVAYTVTYTVIDAGNNFTTISFKTQALTDKESPIINREDKEYTMELGTYLDLGEITASDNVAVEDIQYSSDGNNYLNGTIFTPLELGVYTITITAKDAQNNEATPVTLTVTVEDTTAPEIIVNNGIPYEDEIKVMPTSGDEYEKVFIPDYIAQDISNVSDKLAQIGISKSEVKVSGPNGTSYTLDNTNPDYKLTHFTDGMEGTTYERGYYFVPQSKGTYTITYSATDLNGNNAESKQIIVRAGDTVKPTITITDEGDIKTTVKPGETVSIDVKKIVVTDNIDTDLKYSTIKMYKTGTTTEVSAVISGDEENIYSYTLEEAGSYTLEITAKDDAGNTNTKTIVFTASDDVKEGIDKEEIIGIVLIVVCVLVLAGVIIYFVTSRKRRIKK